MSLFFVIEVSRHLVDQCRLRSQGIIAILLALQTFIPVCTASIGTREKAARGTANRVPSKRRPLEQVQAQSQFGCAKLSVHMKDGFTPGIP
jgi:hypothetical protein